MAEIFLSLLTMRLGAGRRLIIKSHDKEPFTRPLGEEMTNVGEKQVETPSSYHEARLGVIEYNGKEYMDVTDDRPPLQIKESNSFCFEQDASDLFCVQRQSTSHVSCTMEEELPEHNRSQPIGGLVIALTIENSLAKHVNPERSKNGNDIITMSDHSKKLKHLNPSHDDQFMDQIGKERDCPEPNKRNIQSKKMVFLEYEKAEESCVYSGQDKNDDHTQCSFQNELTYNHKSYRNGSDLCDHASTDDMNISANMCSQVTHYDDIEVYGDREMKIQKSNEENNDLDHKLSIVRDEILPCYGSS